MAWSWVEGWGKAAAGLGGTIGHGFGAMLDLVTGDSNGYTLDQYGQPVIAPSEFDKMLTDMGKMFSGIGQGTGWVGDGVGWLLEKDYQLYSDWVSRPIATVFTQQTLRNSEEWQKRHGLDTADNPWDAIRSNFVGWEEAWERNTDKKTRTSPGRAYTYLLTGTDLEDQHDIEDAQRHWWFRLLSGGADAATLMTLDPATVASRGAAPLLRSTKNLPTTLTEMGSTREVRNSTKATREIVPKGTIQGEVIGSDAVRGIVGPNTPMSRTLDWAQRQADKAENPLDAARVIGRHALLRNSEKGGLIASMLADSSRHEMDLVMRIAMGDGRTYDELNGVRADLTARLTSLYDVRPDLAMVENTDETGRLLPVAEKALNERRLSYLNDEVDALERRVKWLDDLLGNAEDRNPGLLGSLGERPKGGIYQPAAQKAAEARGFVQFYSQRAIGEKWNYYNQFNTPVRVLGVGLGKLNHFLNENRPAGHLDLNDPEGWRELDNMLSRTKGFEPARRQQLVTQYMRATAEGEKLRLAQQAEREAITHAAGRYGIDAEDIADVVTEFTGQRGQMMAMLKNRAYTGATDPASGRRLDFVDSENIPNVIHPMLATQLADKLPLADMDTVQRAFARHNNVLKAVGGSKVRDPLVNAADILSAWWKTASLMRFGYLVRVLADDEMAYIAKLGAMTAFEPAARGTENWVRNRGAQAKALGRRASYRAQNIVGFATGVTPQAWARELPEDLASYEKRRITDDSGEILLEDGRTVSVQGFTPPTKSGEYWRSRLTSDDRIHMDMEEGARLRAMRREMGHGLVNKGDYRYHNEWAKALNRQLGQDELARRLLKGESVESVVQWLRRDPAGRAYARRLPYRSADPERWVHNVDEFVRQYATTPEVRAAALAGEATAKMLKRLPDEFQPGQVHGALLDFNMGRGPAARVMQEFREGFYRHFNQIPTDVLIRHPLAKALYERRRNELVQRFNNTGGRLDNTILRTIENQARSHTVSEVNKVVLDLTHHSNAAHVFRFVAPFYNAWDRALRRWGRLAYGNPSIIFKGNNLWQGVNNMPLMFDSEGDVETAEGKVLYGRNQRGFTGLANANDQLLTFRLPERMAEKIGARVLNQVQIPKSSLNLVLQGDPWYLPGFGPFVQVPVSQLTMNMPQHEELLKTILPYGPQSFSDAVLPTSLRKLGQWQDEDGNVYASMRVNIFRSRYAQWIESGRQGPEPAIHDPQIEKDAKRLFALRFFTQMIAPVNVRYTTPYKFYVDQYHRLMLPPEQGGVGPDRAYEAFLARYPDYFMFAESISRNNARIPATVEASQATKRYKGMLAQTPDIAQAILGSAATQGAFSPTVYRQQFNQRLSPASSQTVRSSRDLDEFAQDALVSKGWQFYRKYADLLRVELSNRGLQSFQQSGAEDLQLVRQAVVNKLRDENPAWYTEFSSYDATKQANIIGQLETAAGFKALQGRSDIRVLQAYLTRRDQMVNELHRRDLAGGSGDITAVANRDLYQQWQYDRDRLADADTLFSENIFDRYLVHDDALRA